MAKCDLKSMHVSTHCMAYGKKWQRKWKKIPVEGTEVSITLSCTLVDFSLRGSHRMR